LAEVAVLSKMTSVRVKLLARHLVNEMLGQPLNPEKIKKLTSGSRLDFSPEDIKAILAALTFIIKNAIRFEVSDDVLALELEQLGLPRDICNAICRTIAQHRQELTQRQRESILRLPRLAKLDWRVDYILASSDVADADSTSVRLKLHIQKPSSGDHLEAEVPPERVVAFEASVKKLNVLLNDLKQARAIMQAAGKQ